MIQNFLTLTLEVLFFTNIWQFLYIHILNYLNSNIPPKPPSQDFIRLPAELAPEPYEIPLYLMLIFFIVILVIFYYRFLKPTLLVKIKENFSAFPFSVLKLALLFFLVFIFFGNLGSYPLAHDVFPYNKQTNPAFYLAILMLYLLPLSIIIVESALFEKIIQKSKKLSVIFLFFLIGFILLLTFDPRFPMSTLDYSLFFGPVLEIANGKTIYTQAPSLYGFLSILALGLFYKIKILNMWYLPAIIWILYTAQYILVFWLLYKVSKSLVLSLLGLFSILTLNYYSLFHLPSTIPQTGPMRWFSLIIALTLFNKIKKIDSKLFIFFIALLSFWNIDNGIALLLGYVFTLFLIFISREINFRRAIKSFSLLIFDLVAIFIIIQIIHIVSGYKPIDIFLTFGKIIQYARGGFGMLPMQAKTYFWLVILVYFASIIYVFRNTTKEKQLNELLLFSANISIFGSVYFIGRSHPHNLFHISLIFLVNTFIFLAIILPKLHKPALIYLLIFLAFIVFPAIQRQEIITSMMMEKYSRFKTGSIFIPETLTILTKTYAEEISLIKSQMQEGKILILFDDDSYLFYMTKKENIMDYNPQILNFTKQDFNISLNKALQNCPKKIIGDCRIFGRCSNITPFTQTYLYIQPLLLEKIESSCRLKYEAQICSKYLCTAISKN